MTEAQKKWIDNATYEQLLERWRFAPLSSPWFYGECGEYYGKRMAELRSADPDEHVAASKRIGWVNPGR